MNDVSSATCVFEQFFYSFGSPFVQTVDTHQKEYAYLVIILHRLAMKKAGKGIFAPKKLSEALAAICGKKVMPRTEVTKAVRQRANNARI